jgi:cytochrome c-type biogenesis protein CcmH
LKIMRKLMLATLLLVPLLGGCEDAGAPSISGTISMDPKLQQTLGASDTLFIVAKPKEAGGPPLAVQKIVGMKFPLDYKFTQEDVLRPGTALQGEVTVSAVIRKSGFVGMNTPGDMEGAYAKPVSVGTQHVDFAIDQVNK